MRWPAWLVALLVAPSVTVAAVWSSTVAAVVSPRSIPPVVAVRLSSDAPDADGGSPRVALDRRGDAFAVWGERTSTGVVTEAAIRPLGGHWSKAVQLAHGGFSELSVDPRGDALVAGLTIEPRRGVFVAFRAAGGRWRSARTVVHADAVSVSVAIDQLGRALVGWAVFEPSDQEHVYVAARSRRGAWTQPRLLGSGEGVGLAKDGRGDALAVWHSPWNRDGTIETAWRPLGHAWERPRTVPAPTNVLAVPGIPHVGLDAHGNALVLWNAWAGDNPPGHEYILEAASARFDQRFGTPQQLGSSPDGLPTALAMAPNGRAAAVFVDGRDDGVVRAAVRQSTATNFLPPVALDPQAAFDPAVAITPTGRTLALWTQITGSAAGGNLRLVAAGRAPGRGFTAAFPIASVGGDCFEHRCETGGHARVALARNGDGILVWVEKASGDSSVGGVVFAASLHG